MVPVCMESNVMRCWRIETNETICWQTEMTRGQTVANQKLRKHPCETPCPLWLDTWSGMSCERCVIYPQHLWIAWGFKVQSGFQTTEARRVQRKMLKLQIQPEVVCQDSNLMVIKVSPEERKPSESFVFGIEMHRVILVPVPGVSLAISISAALCLNTQSLVVYAWTLQWRCQRRRTYRFTDMWKPNLVKTQGWDEQVHGARDSYDEQMSMTTGFRIYVEKLIPVPIFLVEVSDKDTTEKRLNSWKWMFLTFVWYFDQSWKT